jgi:hypothetical protein
MGGRLSLVFEPLELSAVEGGGTSGHPFETRHGSPVNEAAQ